MTIDEAKQKILQRVLETKTGWKVTLQDVYADSVCVVVRNDNLPGVKVGREKDAASEHISIQCGEAESAVDSTEFPELLQWFEDALKKSHEQRIIQFAESL